jgi:hypothetical protein
MRLSETVLPFQCRGYQIRSSVVIAVATLAAVCNELRLIYTHNRRGNNLWKAVKVLTSLITVLGHWIRANLISRPALRIIERWVSVRHAPDRSRLPRLHVHHVADFQLAVVVVVVVMTCARHIDYYRQPSSVNGRLTPF